jgi:hypothetical protein
MKRFGAILLRSIRTFRFLVIARAGCVERLEHALAA